MFTIIDYSRERYLTLGLQAIATHAQHGTRKRCIVVPDRERPLSSLLAFRQEHAGRWQDVIVLLDALSAPVATAVMGTEHRVSMAGRRESPAVLLSLMNRMSREKAVPFLPARGALTPVEIQLALSLRSELSPEQIAGMLQKSVKTLSAQKRRIMEKLGVSGNVMFMKLVADPAFIQTMALLSAQWSG